jgi:hypothetical protein
MKLLLKNFCHSLSSSVRQFSLSADTYFADILKREQASKLRSHVIRQKNPSVFRLNANQFDPRLLIS